MGFCANGKGEWEEEHEEEEEEEPHDESKKRKGKEKYNCYAKGGEWTEAANQGCIRSGRKSESANQNAPGRMRDSKTSRSLTINEWPSELHPHARPALIIDQS